MGASNLSTLVPAFQKSITEYDYFVASTPTTVEFKATPYVYGASITQVNDTSGTVVPSSAGVWSVSVPSGGSEVKLMVQAYDQNTTQVYKVNIKQSMVTLLGLSICAGEHHCL